MEGIRETRNKIISRLRITGEHGRFLELLEVPTRSEKPGLMSKPIPAELDVLVPEDNEGWAYLNLGRVDWSRYFSNTSCEHTHSTVFNSLSRSTQLGERMD